MNRLCTHHRAKHWVSIKTDFTLRKTRPLVIHVVWSTSLPLWVRPLWKSGLPKVSQHPRWFLRFVLGVKDSQYTLITNSQWHASEWEPSWITHFCKVLPLHTLLNILENDDSLNKSTVRHGNLLGIFRKGVGYRQLPAPRPFSPLPFVFTFLDQEQTPLSAVWVLWEKRSTTSW